MKNKYILIAVVLVLIALLFGSWKFMSKPTSTANIPAQNIVDEIATSGSFFDLMKMNKTLKCTYSNDTEGTKINGSTYVSGKRMRTDFESKDSQGNMMTSHMISDGKWIYSWSSAAPQGFKMSLADAENKNANGESPVAAANIDQKATAFNDAFDYKCTPWSEESSKFNTPSDVQFTDFSEMMKGLNSGKGNAMCVSCNYAQSEEDKAACKKQFNCE